MDWLLGSYLLALLAISFPPNGDHVFIGKESTCAGDKNESCPTVSYLTQIWPCGVRKHVRSTVIWEPCQLPATRKEEMGGGSFADYDWRGQRGSSLGWVKLLEVVGSGSRLAWGPALPSYAPTSISVVRPPIVQQMKGGAAWNRHSSSWE